MTDILTAAISRQSVELDRLEFELRLALEQCRRRGRAQNELIRGDGTFTDPDWRVSLPGSGYGSGGGLGTGEPWLPNEGVWRPNQGEGDGG